MAKARIKRIKDFDAGTVRFDVLETGESLEATFDSLSPKMQRYLGVHGLNDRIAGAASDPKVSALAAMTKMWENLLAEIWSVKGEGVARVTDLIAALMEYTGQNQPDVEAKLDAMKAADEANGTKDVAALKKHPDLQPILERMKTERQKDREKEAKAAAKGNETPLSF